MAFEKGKSGNPNGRPKGVPNKTTQQIREMVNDFLTDNFDSVVEAFNELKPRERARVYIDLLQYGLPKLQAMSLKTDLDELTDEQLDEIVNKIHEERINNLLKNEEERQAKNN